MSTSTIPLRVARTLLNALNGGVVPRIGLGHITVGRKDEIDALLLDIDTVREGGASFRFISGRFGSGKSFLLQAIRNYAMEQGFVVADADLSPDRRLTGNKGEGLATYKELMKNLSTQTSPDGGALALLLQRWINTLRTEVMEEGGLPADDPSLNSLIEVKIHRTLGEIQTLVNGFDFAKIVSIYWRSYLEDDDYKRDLALKWLRGEYATKTAAKNELGVGSIITDDDWYEYVKLFSLFVVKAGYKGMLMLIDELVNISRIPHSVSRQYNYEMLLSIYNDTLQGKARYLGVIMCGTPQSIEDPRRGVFSYEALRSRLESSRFADAASKDLLSPIIRLKPLEPAEMYVLTEKLEQIHALVYGYEPKLTHDELAFFIQSEYSRVGADQNITPREIIRDFIGILNIIMQNPHRSLREILGGGDFEYAAGEGDDSSVKDAFSGFEI